MNDKENEKYRKTKEKIQESIMNQNEINESANKLNEVRE